MSLPGASADDVLIFHPTDKEFGLRVDLFVAERLANVTRAEVQRWIDASRVLVNGAACRRKDKVRPGVVVQVAPDSPPATDAEPDASVVLDVVFEDNHLLVVNKPAGLVVHPGRGHRTGTMVNGLLARPGFERAPSDPRDPQGQLRPGIVHRIDKETSGLLVVAKTAVAREGLKVQLGAHTVERVYQALTVGAPHSKTIRTLHGRDPHSRLRFSSRVVRGKEAVTHLRVLQSLRSGHAALVECRLETGRTHQIRVHLSLEMNTPILGDTLYGGLRGNPFVVDVAKELGRHALHAGVLGFVHPTTGESLHFEAPLPPDMKKALEALQA